MKVDNDGATFAIKHVASQELLTNQNVKDIGKYYAADGTSVSRAERIQPSTKQQRYEVARVVGDRGIHGVDKQYQVQWKGLWDDTWEPEENLDCPKLVQDYHRRKARAAPKLHTAAMGSQANFAPQPWSLTVTLDLSTVDA